MTHSTKAFVILICASFAVNGCTAPAGGTAHATLDNSEIVELALNHWFSVEIDTSPFPGGDSDHVIIVRDESSPSYKLPTIAGKRVTEAKTMVVQERIPNEEELKSHHVEIVAIGYRKDDEAYLTFKFMRAAKDDEYDLGTVTYQVIWDSDGRAEARMHTMLL